MENLSRRAVLLGGASLPLATPFMTPALAQTRWQLATAYPDGNFHTRNIRSFLDEVKGEVDMSRVHFVGQVPHHLLQRLLQVSAVHTYLTYPFVLSWSMLEAMSAGALVVGSDTAPVREVIRHGENGLLVDFFDSAAWARTLIEALAEPERFVHLRAAARQTVLDHYDLQSVCLPQQLEWVAALKDHNRNAQ
jgi:glycosyltransferase involved in cell wall biosynthesis